MPTRKRPKSLTTGDLARRTGTTLRAVRFYEEAGILCPHRASSGRREYSEADAVRLQLIADLRELDLSIEEIKRFLELRDGCETAPDLAARLRPLISDQLERTHRRLAALRRLETEFVGTLELLGSCRSCEKPLADTACAGCGVMAHAPRLMRVVVAQAPTGGCEACGPREPLRDDLDEDIPATD